MDKAADSCIDKTGSCMGKAAGSCIDKATGSCMGKAASLCLDKENKTTKKMKLFNLKEKTATSN